MVATLVAKPLAPSTVRQVYKLLSMIYRSAVYDRRVVASPCYKVGLRSSPPGNLVMFEIDEIPLLLGAAKPEQYAAFITLVATGVRQGELLGLTANRINFLRRELSVNQQLVREATSLVVVEYRRLLSVLHRKALRRSSFLPLVPRREIGPNGRNGPQSPTMSEESDVEKEEDMAARRSCPGGNSACNRARISADASHG